MKRLGDLKLARIRKMMADPFSNRNMVVPDDDEPKCELCELQNDNDHGSICVRCERERLEAQAEAMEDR